MYVIYHYNLEEVLNIIFHKSSIHSRDFPLWLHDDYDTVM